MVRSNRRRRFGAAALLLVVLAACSDGPSASLSGATTLPRTDDQPAPPTTTIPPLPTLPPPAASASCPATPARSEPDPRRPRYRLTVDVRLDDNLVAGTTEVTFTPDLDIDRLVFRLWANGPRPTQGGGSITVGDISVDGRRTTGTMDDPTTLSVPLGRTVAAGRSVSAQVPWQLRLPGSSRDRIAREGDAVRLGSFYPILPWEPGVGWNTDAPTGAFAEASTAPVADYDLTVTVPPGLSVLASGESDRPGHWTGTAMRDVALSVGRFTLATGTAMAPSPVQVTVGVHQGINESAERYLNKTLAVLSDFGRRYGPYPWSTFTLAITPNVGGGIEYPSHVMQGPGTIGATTTHEVAHMWFYGLVGNNQGRDPWIDEGLASWAEARYEATVEDFVAIPIPPAAAGRLGQPMTYWATQPTAYVSGVYTQGVQALAALGDPDIVDCALRALTAVYGHRIAKATDVVSALRSAFPNAAAVLARYGVNG